MFFKKIDKGYVLKFENGEKLTYTLLEFIKEEKILSGCYYGIGAVTNVEIGYYHLDKKSYQKKLLDENYEVISLIGNITQVDQKNFSHAHINLSDKNFNCIAGHLFEATVSPSIELFLNIFSSPLYRIDDSEFGFKTLQLPSHFTCAQ
jgi:uncharacterized protein